jgi:hypothetical protein
VRRGCWRENFRGEALRFRRGRETAAEVVTLQRVKRIVEGESGNGIGKYGKFVFWDLFSLPIEDVRCSWFVVRFGVVVIDRPCGRPKRWCVALRTSGRCGVLQKSCNLPTVSWNAFTALLVGWKMLGD